MERTLVLVRGGLAPEGTRLVGARVFACDHDCARELRRWVLREKWRPEWIALAHASWRLRNGTLPLTAEPEGDVGCVLLSGEPMPLLARARLVLQESCRIGEYFLCPQECRLFDAWQWISPG